MREKEDREREKERAQRHPGTERELANGNPKNHAQFGQLLAETPRVDLQRRRIEKIEYYQQKITHTGNPQPLLTSPPHPLLSLSLSPQIPSLSLLKFPLPNTFFNLFQLQLFRTKTLVNDLTYLKLSCHLNNYCCTCHFRVIFHFFNVSCSVSRTTI